MDTEKENINTTKNAASLAILQEIKTGVKDSVKDSKAGEVKQLVDAFLLLNPEEETRRNTFSIMEAARSIGKTLVPIGKSAIQVAGMMTELRQLTINFGG